MTIDNAWDEKWSEWISYDGKICPVKEDAIFQVRLRGDSDAYRAQPQMAIYWSWRNTGFDGDIIAYRYKIKEPDSDMEQGLYELAKNVTSWPDHAYWGAWLSKHEGAKFSTGFFGWPLDLKPHHTAAYNKFQWQAARQQLGLDQPEVTPVNKCLDNAWDVTPEEDRAWAEKQKKANSKGEKYSAYFKDVRHIDTIDVYRVVSLFDCEKHGHAISHAAKKLLLTGARTGGKDVETEVREAIDSLHRWLEMREEDARA